jgi:aspartyl-tRNA(Asn)/glutamyl-tRNA(Gln) amidotransferase subunit C
MAEPIEDTIRRSAALARLELTEEELHALAPQFARILEAFRELATFPDPGADTDLDPAAVGRVRTDEPRPAADPASLLGGAPRTQDGFYAVPRTVGGES